MGLWNLVKKWTIIFTGSLSICTYLFANKAAIPIDTVETIHTTAQKI